MKCDRQAGRQRVNEQVYAHSCVSVQCLHSQFKVLKKIKIEGKRQRQHTEMNNLLWERFLLLYSASASATPEDVHSHCINCMHSERNTRLPLSAYDDAIEFGQSTNHSLACFL